MMITFEHSDQEFSKVFETIEHKAHGMEKATRVSFDETMNEVRARTQREIFTTMAIRNQRLLSVIEPNVKLKDAAEHQRGMLYIDDSKTLPLNAFEAKQTDEGVAVKFSSFGGFNAVYLHAFGPDIPKLGRNIYVRATKMRFPLIKIKDLVVHKIPGAKEAFQEGVRDAEDRLRKNLQKAADEVMK